MLTHQQLTVSTLGSGSRGNATYIGNAKSGLLVDCGLSTRQIMKRLEQIGRGNAPIKGVLITHEHSDHIGAARILETALQRRQNAKVPFYMTPGTARGLPEACRPKNIVEIRPDRPFRVGHWIVEPLAVPHDTPEPVAYTIQAGSLRVGVLTDFGHVTASIRRQVETLDIAVLEFNHDLQMLMSGSYPQRLKERVSGPYGHLSNAQAAELVRSSASQRLKHIVLAHLSQDNNGIDRAYLACSDALAAAGLTKVKIHVAAQAEPLRPIGTSPVSRHPLPTKSRLPKSSPSTPRQPSLFPDLL